MSIFSRRAFPEVLFTMKICFLAHNIASDNGAGVFSKRIIDGLRKVLNAEVIVLTTQGSGEPYERAILYPNRRKLLAQFFAIRKLCKSADIVHALDVYPYGVVMILATFGLSKKRFMTAVGTGALANLSKPLYGRLMRYAYRHADRVFAISRFTARELEQKIPGISVEVIPHGVDFDRFERARTLRREKVVVPYTPYILSVGTLRWRKGYHKSIEAFATVAKAIPGIKYVIVGKRSQARYLSRLRDLIVSLGLTDRVLILDSVDSFEEKQRLYGGAELFCLMSQNYDNRDYEGFGLVFLEAAACGLPVVGTNRSGIEDAVLDQKNGILVDPEDIDGFAKAVIAILGDRNKASAFSESSLSFAKSTTWEEAVAQYVRAYKGELLSLGA